jgi:hypothetical protein
MNYYQFHLLYTQRVLETVEDLLVHKDLPGQLVLMVHKDLPEHKDLPGLLAHKDLLVQMDKMELRDRQDRQVRQVHKDLPDQVAD